MGVPMPSTSFLWRFSDSSSFIWESFWDDISRTRVRYLLPSFVWMTCEEISTGMASLLLLYNNVSKFETIPSFASMERYFFFSASLTQSSSSSGVLSPISASEYPKRSVNSAET